MRQVIGQAAGAAGRTLHRLVRVALLLLVLPAAGLLGLAWRLDQGPLSVPWLADQLVEAANRQIAPMRIEVGEAALVWEGFSRGVDRPLDIRVRDLVVHDAEGRRVAQVPEVDVSLSVRALATGTIAPRGLVVQGARVRAVRKQDGSLAVDFTAPREDETVLPAAHRPVDFAWLFEALAQPPGFGAEGRASLLGQLRRLQLRDIRLVLHDNALGVVWRTQGLEVDVTRFAAGGLEGTAALDLLVEDRRLTASARLSLPPVHPGMDEPGATPTLAVEATVAPLVPADFAGLSPAFAPLAAVRAPVALTATAELGPDLLPRHGRLQARMDAGVLRIGAGQLAVSGGLAEIEGSTEGMRLALRRLALPTGGGARQTVLTGTATVRPQGTMLAGVLDLQLDQVGFADLAELWPAGIGPGAKEWVTENITAGTAHDLHLRLRVLATPDLTDGEVTELSGGVEGRDMVVHWLRPVPPTERVAARLAFLSANEIEITARSGVQAGLVLTGGTVRLTGLAQNDEYAAISMDVEGPVPDLVALLNHPRLNLLSRRPVTMRNPAGRVEGRVVIAPMPLVSDLKMDDVRISARGKVSALALGGIAAGHDLTNGALAFEAGNDGLRLSGTATLAGIPSQLAVEADFTAGPPSQVIQKITLSGTAEAAQMVALGLDTQELALEGSAALKLELVGRRSGRSELSVRGDLARLGLRAERLNWAKPAGRPATGELQAVLLRDRLAGIERLRLEGEGVSVQAALDMPAGAPRKLRLARAVLGNGTHAQGEIQWPRAEGQPWVVRLSGQSLDLTGEMARRDPVKPGEDQRGPPWSAELQVDRLVLGPGRIITGVRARSENDGLNTRIARITGRAGLGPFELSILPSGLPRRRSLTITAQDAGGLLAALDVTDQIRGGRLDLTGSYDDARADHLLSGTAEITGFGVRDAPVVAKLLQAVTVVGAFEALSGPDLNFTRLVAPFRYRGDMIELADARAFSASLGLTIKGRADMARRQFDLQGTVVPAYFLNSLLGRVPVIGKLVSPETGGGLFAMNYTVTGGFDDPSVRVNPLSAVAPGFLRGLFESAPGSGAPATPAPGSREGGQN